MTVLMVELAALLGLVAVGWVLAGPDRGGVWRVLVALPLGIAATTVVELVLLLTRLQVARPWSALAVTLVAVVAVATVRARSGRTLGAEDTAVSTISGGRAAAVGLLVLVGVAALTSAVPLVNLTPDSFRFIPTSHVLSTGGDVEGVSLFLLTTRGLALPTTHGLAVTEFGYLRAVGPLFGLATLGLLWWSVEVETTRLGGGWSRLLGVAAAVLLLTNSRFLFSTFYLNTHVLFAFLFLLIVVLARSMILHPGSDRGARDAWLVGLAAAGLALLRAEGPLVAALALAPLVLDGAVPLRRRQISLVVFAVVVTAWQLGMLLPISLADPQSLNVSVVGLGIFGAVLLALAPFLGLLVPRVPRPLLVIHVVVWLAMIGLGLQSPRLVRDSAVATAQNVGGAGLWGVSLVVLAVLVGVGVLLRRVPAEQAFVFPLATFVPLAVLLAILRDAAYRLGPGDSLNRMLIHFVPVAILALSLSVVGESRQGRIEEPTTGTA